MKFFRQFRNNNTFKNLSLNVFYVAIMMDKKFHITKDEGIINKGLFYYLKKLSPIKFTT